MMTEAEAIILDLTPFERGLVDWERASGCERIRLDFIAQYRDLPWDYQVIVQRPDITREFLERAAIPWSNHLLGKNNLTLQDVFDLSGGQITDQNILEAHFNVDKLTIDFLRTAIEPTLWRRICRYHPEPEKIAELPEADFEALFRNEHITDEFVIRYADKNPTKINVTGLSIKTINGTNLIGLERHPGITFRNCERFGICMSDIDQSRSDIRILDLIMSGVGIGTAATYNPNMTIEFTSLVAVGFRYSVGMLTNPEILLDSFEFYSDVVGQPCMYVGRNPALTLEYFRKHRHVLIWLLF